MRKNIFINPPLKIFYILSFTPFGLVMKLFTRLIKPYLLTDKTSSGMWYWYLVSVKPHLVCGIGIWYLILVLIEIYYSLSAASSFYIEFPECENHKLAKLRIVFVHFFYNL